MPAQNWKKYIFVGSADLEEMHPPEEERLEVWSSCVSKFFEPHIFLDLWVIPKVSLYSQPATHLQELWEPGQLCQVGD